MKRLATFALVVVLASACAGGGDDSDRADTVMPESPTTTEQPVGDLETQLLTVSDLPTGYTVSADDEEEGAGTSRFCGGKLEFTVVATPKQEAEVSFEKSGETAFNVGVLLEGLAEFTEDEAVAVMDHVHAVADQCQTFDDTMDDGTRFTGRMSVLSFPKLGDDTFAVRMSGDASTEGIDVPFAADVITVRKGRVVMLIANFGGGLNGVDSSVTESVATKALEKVS